MNRRALILAALAAAALLAGNWFSERTERARGIEAQRHVPDYFLAEFTATTLDEGGRPRYRLSAERLEHYADTDTAELTEPRVVVHRTDEPDWHLQAERGQVGPGGEVVYLTGSVEIHQPDAGEGPPLRLATERLELRPGERYAETDAAVVITGPGSRTEGIGMRVFLDEERLELLSDVYGTHEPVGR